METQVKNKTGNRELTVSRLLNAPVELVWEVWTNPEHIKYWWGPNGFTNTIYKMDVKPGGEWELMMHGPDGKNFWNKHTYTEVVKHEKLVHVHGPEPKFEMTITFTAQGNKTLVTMLSVFESAEVLQKVVEEYGAAEGMKQNVDKLENYLNNLPAERELVIMRQFNAPRELVFKAWTEPERLAQWWGPKGVDYNVIKLELKPGGMFLYNMKNPTGQDIWGKFIYHEITAPEKLVFVNSFSDKDGGTTRNPWMPVWPLEIMNTVTLIEHEGRTTLTIKGKPINATAEEMKSFESFRHLTEGGFAGMFEKLEEYLGNN